MGVIINDGTQHAQNRAWRWLPSGSETRDLLWWYLTNLTAVCVFKSIHFASLYRQGFLTAAGIRTSGAIERAFDIALIFTADALQIGVVVLLVYLVARRLLGISFNIPLLFATILILLVGTGSVLSIQELGTPLSFDTLLLSIDWIRSDPSIVGPHLGERNGLGVAIIMGWCSIPFIMPRLDAYDAGRHSARHLIWTRIFRIVVTLIIVGSAAFAYRVFGTHVGLLLGMSVVTAVLVPRYLPVGSRLRLLNLAVKRIALGAAVIIFAVSGVYQLSQAFNGPKSSVPLFAGYMPTVAKSLFAVTSTDYGDLPVVSTEDLRSQYHALVYPGRDDSPPVKWIDLDPASLVARHIVIVSFETAPMRYYRLFDDPALPNFYRLSRQAIINEHHYTNTPFTTNAAASIMSGLYAVASDPDHRFVYDALPRVLGEHNYHTSYIDSYLIDWRSGPPRNRRLFENMGFQSLVDASDIPAYDHSNKTFEYRAQLENKAIERAASTILDAEAAGDNGMVFVQTFLGHFPWRSSEGDEGESAEEKLYGLVRECDKTIGILLERLDEAGLTDKTIIVITGDHGLRYNAEFESVGLQFAHTDAAFNVPLIISAPGLLRRKVEVPFVTSHVDLAPTLLAMVGISSDRVFHHGENILSGESADRVTYMMNTNLSPVDGLHWNGLFLTYDALRGVAELATGPTRSDAQPIDQAIDKGQFVPARLVQLNAHFANARRIFDLTNAHFLVSPEQIADE